MKEKTRLLVIAEQESDLTAVLESCGAQVIRLSHSEALDEELSSYDAYCVLLPGKVLDARLRERLERENARGKRVFTEALMSYLDVYSARGRNTVRSRLIYLEPEDGKGIPGLKTGDLLDDESNVAQLPYFLMKDTVPLLVYREYIIAHAHTDMEPEEIRKDAKPGLWKCCGDTVMMTSFWLHNYNRARFAPRDAWTKLIRYIAEWLTGSSPSKMPEPVVWYGPGREPAEEADFEKCRSRAIDKGIKWLEGFLVDQGRGGILEGLYHDIDPEGRQTELEAVRADCSGESAGAFRMYARRTGDAAYAQIAENLEGFVYGPMVVKGGLFDGMMRWTAEGWGVCYQDDVARAILPALYGCAFFGEERHFPEIRQILDFLVKTTARDGTRVSRTDRINLDEEKMRALREAETGYPSAHYNSYYSAALLLAYRHCREERYLEVGKRGLETLMSLYPETVREQSETQEMCRLVLPLAILYGVTGEEKHREWLYRVTDDLQKVRHPFGGYREWDTGYKAKCNRNSTGECSILTENGDPVADSLYSVNFLPMGFACAYLATGDERFHDLWRDIVAFFIRIQIGSDDPRTDGSWCRAFDMDLGEAYAAPHDCGWATYSSETGWTCAEILMGMMFPDLAKKPCFHRTSPAEKCR